MRWDVIQLEVLLGTGQPIGQREAGRSNAIRQSAR